MQALSRPVSGRPWHCWDNGLQRRRGVLTWSGNSGQIVTREDRWGAGTWQQLSIFASRRAGHGHCLCSSAARPTSASWVSRPFLRARYLGLPVVVVGLTPRVRQSHGVVLRPTPSGHRPRPRRRRDGDLRPLHPPELPPPQSHRPSRQAPRPQSNPGRGNPKSAAAPAPTVGQTTRSDVPAGLQARALNAFYLPPWILSPRDVIDKRMCVAILNRAARTTR
jgi:hypothetical protein